MVVINPDLSLQSTLSVVRNTIGYPAFVKPSSGGGSLAAGIAHDEPTLMRMIEATQSDPYAEYMVEEYVQGIPCTVGLIEVDGRLVTLPVHDVESKNEFYDYEAKHDPALRVEHCPSILPEPTTQNMAYLARRVLQLIGAHGVLRVDFMAGANGRTRVLECNTLPGLSERGNLATMAPGRRHHIPRPDATRRQDRVHQTRVPALGQTEAA